MAFSNIGTYACRALQTDLMSFYGANVPAFKTMGSNALTTALLSPQNTSGFQQITDEITGLPRAVPGKTRAVAFAMDQPYCFDVCSIQGITCQTEHTSLENNTQEIVFDFDRTKPWRPCDANGDPMELKFTDAELQKYCTETNTAYITRKIAAFNKRFLQAFDKRLGELLATKVGQTADGDSLVTMPFFIRHSSGFVQLNPEAFFGLDKVYSDIGGEGQFMLVGGAGLKKIIQYQKWADLSSAGIDLSQIEDVNPFSYYDRFLDQTIGITNFFQMSPGAVQLVTFNDYVGENRRQITDLYTRSTFIDPVTGLEVDFEWDYDYKCKIWEYKPFLYAELAVVPAGGCGIPNANGLLRWADCSGLSDVPTCDESSI